MLLFVVYFDEDFEIIFDVGVNAILEAFLDGILEKSSDGNIRLLSLFLDFAADRNFLPESAYISQIWLMMIMIYSIKLNMIHT